MPSSEDQPTYLYSSSEESDSDSTFPDSSDSEPDTANGSRQASVRVSSRHKDVKTVSRRGEGGSGKTPASLQSHSSEDKPEDAVADSLSGHPRGTDVKLEDQANVELPDGWTGVEVTYFRMLHPVFGHNYCTISAMIRSKTCREVYEYGRVVSADLLQQHGEDTERPLTGKKKKRNMRWVWPHSQGFPHC